MVEAKEAEMAMEVAMEREARKALLVALEV